MIIPVLVMVFMMCISFVVNSDNCNLYTRGSHWARRRTGY